MSGIDNYVKLMLHGDTVVDSSPVPKSLTNVGPVTIDTGNKVFGTGSLLFNTAGNYLSLAPTSDFDFGTSDFTIDFRIKAPAVQPTSYGFLLSGDTGHSGIVVGDAQVGATKLSWTYGDSRIITSTKSILDDTWHHIAFVRYGNTFYLFWDGVQDVSFNCSGHTFGFSNTPTIGAAHWAISSAYFKGNIDEFRISKGIARWTTNFTPPVAAYTIDRFLAKVSNNYYSYATGSWVDLGVPASDTALITLFQNNGQLTCPTQAQLELLGTGTARPVRCCWQESSVDTLPVATVKAVPKDKLFLPKSLITMQSFEGIDNMTPTYISNPSIIDETGNTWTKVGTPLIDSANKKLGEESLRLTSSSFLKRDTSVTMPTNDFTFDWWEYRTSVTDYDIVSTLGKQSTASGNGILVGYVEAGKNVVYAGNDGSSWNILSSFNLGTIDLNQWNHFAFVRQGNTFYGFKNGVLTSTATSSLALNALFNMLTIGCSYTLTGNFFNGYIDEFRVSNMARWTNNFTPSTSAYTIDSNTISLLHFEKDTEIRFIVTKDLTTYYTYNFTNSAWEVIDHTNLATVKTSGITASQLSTIPRAKWDLMTTGAGLAIGYLLSQGSTLDTNYIDSLNIQVDMKGSWDKAIHGTDYTYGYPQNNLLRVKLLTSGDYKINYNEGSSSS